MKNACAPALLVLALTILSAAQTQTAKPLSAALEQVQRVEILYFPERILVRAALSPERLEQLYQYKLEIRDVRESAEWQLLPPLSETSVKPSGHAYDHRTAVLLFDKDGLRIASLYFDQFGTGGTINGESGTISGGIYRWAKSLLKGVAGQLAKQCAVKGAGLQRMQLPPGNWIAPLGGCEPNRRNSQFECYRLIVNNEFRTCDASCCSRLQSHLMSTEGTPMTAMRVLAFALFVVVQAASQDAPKMFPYPVPQDGPSGSPVQARCKFSDGKTITVDYSTRHIKTDVSPFDLRPTGSGWATVFNDITFVTGENLITVEGMSVLAGDYTIAPTVHLPMVAMKLVLKTHNGGELRVPMSVTKLAAPAENTAIAFERIGGSCMMHLNSKNSNSELSIEFAEKNTDLPVAQ